MSLTNAEWPSLISTYRVASFPQLSSLYNGIQLHKVNDAGEGSRTSRIIEKTNATLHGTGRCWVGRTRVRI